MHNKAGTVRIP